MAELAARAHVISQEANAKVTAAMREALSTASGAAGFAVESARDLVQYLVRRGQMTAEEGERLVREAEGAHAKRSGKKSAKTAAKTAAKQPAAKTVAAKKPKAKAKKR